MKKYRLLKKTKFPKRFSVKCLCGKTAEVTIDESAKEDFKEMMHWDNIDWDKNTEEVLSTKDLERIMEYNSTPGMHTFHPCPQCKKKGCRRYKCNDCIMKELDVLVGEGVA